MIAITNCYTRAAATSAIVPRAKRFTCSMFIVSSFRIFQFHSLRPRHILNANARETENRESRFAKMLSRSNWTGLFDNQEHTMKAKHSFDLGDIVTVFQMSVSKGLMIEGQAAIVEKVEDVDEQYVVRFRGDADDDVYERFVDVIGQTDPQAYVREINKKLNIAA